MVPPHTHTPTREAPGCHSTAAHWLWQAGACGWRGPRRGWGGGQLFPPQGDVAQPMHGKYWSQRAGDPEAAAEILQKHVLNGNEQDPVGQFVFFIKNTPKDAA